MDIQVLVFILSAKCKKKRSQNWERFFIEWEVIYCR
jgi:hypothetical protein